MAHGRREISSSRNPVIQHFRAAGRGEIDGQLLVEGARIVGEALAARLPVVAAAVSPRFGDGELSQRLREVARDWIECSDEVLARMSALETPPGVAAIVERPRADERDLLRAAVPLVVVAAGVRDPGNLGALLRTAEAAGASGCIAMKGGADPFRDKAVRGSMGSVFRLPVVHGLDAERVVAFARGHGLQIVVADGNGEVVYADADLRRPSVLVVGAEAAGVPPELARAADARLRIPLSPAVESLNVAVAAGVLLFEAQRQRRGGRDR